MINLLKIVAINRLDLIKRYNIYDYKTNEEGECIKKKIQNADYVYKMLGGFVLF